MPEKKELVLAMPVSSGWEIVLDGMERLEPEGFYGLLMKLDIPAGVHHITLDYHIPGLRTGAAVSLLSLLIFTAVYGPCLCGSMEGSATMGIRAFSTPGNSATVPKK